MVHSGSTDSDAFICPNKSSTLSPYAQISDPRIDVLTDPTSEDGKRLDLIHQVHPQDTQAVERN